MSPVLWVIVAVLVIGVVAAVFGWDRYGRNRKASGGDKQNPWSKVQASRKVVLWPPAPEIAGSQTDKYRSALSVSEARDEWPGVRLCSRIASPP